MEESAASTTSVVIILEDLLVAFCEEKPNVVMVLERVGIEGVTLKWESQNWYKVCSVTGSCEDRCESAKPTRRDS